MKASAHPDSRRLARIGANVRGRLDRQPGARRLGNGKAEIYALDTFLDAGECAHLIGLIDALAQPSRVLDEEQWPDYRTSCSSDLHRDDACVQAIEKRLCDLTGIASACSEAVQGQRYESGQYFNEHCDWFDTEASYWARESGCGGQRSWTAMVYLNAVEKGGATDFTRMCLSVTPQPGALLLWNNAMPDGSPNPWTMHAARPVLRGTKYVVTKWFRARTWQ